MTRRSLIEIYIDILKAVAEDRRKPTHIMYRANLTWTRLKRHLEFLIGQELLIEQQINGSSFYYITPRGRELVEYRKRIERELYYTRRLVTSKILV